MTLDEYQELFMDIINKISEFEATEDKTKTLLNLVNGMAKSLNKHFSGRHLYDDNIKNEIKGTLNNIKNIDESIYLECNQLFQMIEKELLLDEELKLDKEDSKSLTNELNTIETSWTPTNIVKKAIRIKDKYFDKLVFQAIDNGLNIFKKNYKSQWISYNTNYEQQGETLKTKVYNHTTSSKNEKKAADMLNGRSAIKKLNDKDDKGNFIYGDWKMTTASFLTTSFPSLNTIIMTELCKLITNQNISEEVALEVYQSINLSYPTFTFYGKQQNIGNTPSENQTNEQVFG